ncbi:RNA polymerase sigma factor [Actinomadura kijaniata]|uniref:RNA polymerase sigma factor n=1 Tax=Actinomadura kijaniata TaxID=46161 RepID=UPI000ACAF873|nr:sigma-70 family RNA polymerase sigma factor [Actinomadura kijaniata]
MALEGQDDIARLVARARDGDGAAWDRLVERHSAMLWSIARAHGLNEADAGDVVQTAWLRLVERLDRVEDAAAVGGWLSTTARRESLRAARRRTRERPDDPGDPPVPDHQRPERVVLARDRLDRVALALQELPRRCQVLLRLLATAPSYADLADLLDMPVGSIGPTRARCLAALNRRLEQ